MSSGTRSTAVALVVACFLLSGCSGSQERTDAADDDPVPTPAHTDDADDADAGVDGAGGPTEPDPDAIVERVIDGDSVDLRIDGELVEARLIGINAPELADCQGPAAREVLADLADAQGVAVRDFGSDRFGRLLVDLTIAGDSVNLAMVEAGWALGQHDDEHGAAGEWVAAMERAAAERLGMWDLPELCPPADAELVIAAVEPDPPGPDDDVLEDEWIELENRGDSPVDLSGWSVRDESTSNRFTFDGGTLAPGQRLRLRTGCGTDTTTDLYWCSPAGVWSNRGETALLLGPSGSIEDWRFLE